MVDHWEKLNPADEAHLKFLRRQVDRLEQIRFSRDAPSSVNTELFQAREELRKFVAGKRLQGYNI